MTENKTGQGTSLQALMGDITKIEVGALVNAANSSLMGGGGVDGAIHREGGSSIRSECREIVAVRGPLEVGQAVITGAGRLPARYVIHTVGPIWHEVTPEEGTRLLASCYTESLGLAMAKDCETVAFPCMSTGAYGLPIGLAATTAIRTVKEWVAARPGELSEVLFVCFDSANLHLYRAGLPSE